MVREMRKSAACVAVLLDVYHPLYICGAARRTKTNTQTERTRGQCQHREGLSTVTAVLMLSITTLVVPALE